MSSFVEVRNKKTGKRRVVLLLNPSEKAKKFAKELRDKRRYTNYGEVKDLPFGDTHKAYRAGYLDARKDGAKAYKSNGSSSRNVNTTNERRLADMYADHMGRKFDLTPMEIRKNAQAHYEEALHNSDFRAWLYSAYGGRL